MEIQSIIEGLISNAIWLIGGGIMLVLLWSFRRIIMIVRAVSMAMRLRSAGISHFAFSRHDYPEQLDAYLNRATQSIKIVSISLRVTSNECALAELFKRKLASNPNFEIVVSLLKPKSSAATLAAHALNVSVETLNSEIREMLDELVKLRDSLPLVDRGRLRILTHNCFPMGSAILIDVTSSSGSIQVETKLYRSPRVESFSFEVLGPSPFYVRNLTAWNAVIAESKLV